jgi:hypothetical protein
MWSCRFHLQDDSADNVKREVHHSRQQRENSAPGSVFSGSLFEIVHKYLDLVDKGWHMRLQVSGRKSRIQPRSPTAMFRTVPPGQISGASYSLNEVLVLVMTGLVPLLDKILAHGWVQDQRDWLLHGPDIKVEDGRAFRGIWEVLVPVLDDVDLYIVPMRIRGE